jgi:hypothetical protein
VQFKNQCNYFENFSFKLFRIAEVKPETEKKKKKKKKKLPKNFNPNIPPDPERWVPLKQRSTYKKRRKGKIEVAFMNVKSDFLEERSTRKRSG